MDQEQDQSLHDSDDEDAFTDGHLTTTLGDVNYQWNDITDQFHAAASQLALGELHHDVSFGLFEAMSAIEMMDPKMDAGMLCNQTKRKIKDVYQAIDDKILVVKDIPIPDLISMMDMTFSCLVTWLEGHSLAQTVFTNLYLHSPSLCEDRTAKAFSICVLKLVDIIRERINRALVYEEEDFQPMSYGFKMANDVSDLRVCGMVKEVEEEYNRVIKNTRLKPGVEDKRDDKTKTEHEHAVAVHARLRLVRLFFSAMVAFTKDKCQGLEDAMKSLNQIEELFPLMKNTLKLGSVCCPASDEEDFPRVMGFEPLINQRLLPPTFPRYTKIKDSGYMLLYLTDVVSRLKMISKVKDIMNLHVAIEFFMEYSKISPCVLSRSILQLVYLSPSRRILGQYPVADILKDTIRSFIAPPGLSTKTSVANGQAREYIDAFLQHASRPMCSMIQLCGHNRARQRDKWAVLLEELAVLQDEADKVDAYLHSISAKSESNSHQLLCYGTWVLYHTLQTMINYTLSGFELELYAQHEYQYIYWYLHECLYSWLLSTLTRAESFLMEQEAAADNQKGRNKKSKNKKKKCRPFAQEIGLNQACQGLCTGFFKAVFAFHLCGKMKEAKLEFDSEEVRFNHRFGSFRQVVTPPVVQYSVYKAMVDPERYENPPTAAEMFTLAGKAFQQTRMILENLSVQSEEVQNLIKVAKTNFVVMKLAAGGHKKDSNEPVEFDFSTHRIFPVIKIN